MNCELFSKKQAEKYISIIIDIVLILAGQEYAALHTLAAGEAQVREKTGVGIKKNGFLKQYIMGHPQDKVGSRSSGAVDEGGKMGAGASMHNWVTIFNNGF